jgi:hypothetical protein
MNEKTQKITRGICRDVQTLLYDYTVRELGLARSEFVREHVRRCDACRAELALIQKTLDVLTMARKAPVPDRLSVHHRRRMSRAVMHPVLDWVCDHNVLVAITATLLTILLSVFILRWAMDVRVTDNSDGVPVNLPHPIPPELPAPPLQPPLQEEVK